MNFWDFCAPFYDFAEKSNGVAYKAMLKTVKGIVPTNSTVLEIAGGTGSISLAVADKAESVLCTDLSERMLITARKKARKRAVSNVDFDNLNIFNISKPNNSFDVVIAAQVLHLLDQPEKAAAELKRVARGTVILPICLLASLSGRAKLNFKFYRLLGFAPKIRFDLNSYTDFLPKIGFENCEIILIDGKMPMAVAIWRKGGDTA
ncbi:MAG: class I SAM-dependent methyltransferase [Oscillospiraceae bacterium]|nr:class I SAM-dependent methyltransferase [Oscillospiraceae bacterium]